MSFLTAVNEFINRNRKETLFSPNIEEDLKWLHSLPNPKSYIEASYLQYRAQGKYESEVKRHIKNIVFAIIYFFYLIRINNKSQSEEKSNICFYLPNKKYLPINENIIFIKDIEKYNLTFRERKMINYDLKKYKYEYYFKIKILIKCGMYGYYIKKYTPDIIYCSSEYSFTSSYLTYFCFKNNVKHYNVQHGEKLLNISNSFFTFDRMYVWDAQYIDLFKQLRTGTKDFILFFPEVLKLKVQGIEEKYYCKYYMQNQDHETMEHIMKLMKKLSKRGKVAVRMHPAYRNKKIEKKYNEIIEDSEKKLDESIGETKYIISLYSTVLLQGKYVGKNIVVDDTNSISVYDNLKKTGYIILKENVLKLSELLNDEC